MLSKALAQVGCQAVVDRAAVGKVGGHVAKGDASRQTGRITACIEAVRSENRLSLTDADPQAGTNEGTCD